MPQAVEILERLQKASRSPTRRALAKFLAISPSNLNQAIERNTVPDLWMYKVAVRTGYRVEWIRDGAEPEQYSALLHNTGPVTDQLVELEGEIERLATNDAQRERLIHTVKDAATILQAVTISDAVSGYKVHRENEAELSGLDAEGKATVHRLIHALLHGDQQIKTHLIGQLKIIEDAVVARKKKDHQHRSE